MTLLQILIQPIAFRDKFLLPLPKPLLLNLNLLRKPLPQLLLLLLKLRIIQLPRPRLSKLACLHLLRPVGFIVRFLRRVDEIQHVRADEDGAELFEVAVVFVFDFGDAPGVLAPFHLPAVWGRDVALAADYAEGHCCDQAAGVLQARFVVFFQGWGVDFYSLGFDYGADLERGIDVSLWVEGGEGLGGLRVA